MLRLPPEFWVVVTEFDVPVKDHARIREDEGRIYGPIVHEGGALSKEQAEGRLEHIGRSRYGEGRVLRVVPSLSEPLMRSGEYLAISKRIEAGTADRDDMRALMREVEKLEDYLSDCWILLSSFPGFTDDARVGDQWAEERESLLRRQQVPGWKGGDHAPAG